MKHDRLAKILVAAAGIPVTSDAAKRLVGWKRAENAHAGNFAEVADEVCALRHRSSLVLSGVPRSC